MIFVVVVIVVIVTVVVIADEQQTHGVTPINSNGRYVLFTQVHIILLKHL